MDRVTIKRLTIFILFIVSVVAVSAGELRRVQMPDRVFAEGKTLVLNGMGLREATIFKASVYVAGLYLESKSSDANAILSSNQVKRLVMHFVRDVKAAQMHHSSKESYENDCPERCTELKDRLVTLNSYLSDVKTGDTMSFTWSPSSTEVQIRGKSVGVINGEDFAKAMLSTWIGSNAPHKNLRDGLLGKKR